MNTPLSSQPDKPSRSGASHWYLPASDPINLDPTSPEAHPAPSLPLETEAASDTLPPAPVRARMLTPGSHLRQRRRLARGLAPVLALALLAGIIAVLRLPEHPTPPAIIQPDSNPSMNLPGTPNSIQAYIVGAVKHPGVYSLQEGDRVYKLLEAAGGQTEGADLARVNLAAHVTDGEEVYVPRVGEPFPAGLNNGGPGKININIASAQDLRILLNISTSNAEKIVAYRHVHGPYTSIEQLLNVIDPATYHRIKNFITV